MKRLAAPAAAFFCSSCIAACADAVTIPKGTMIDESYRAQFAACDQHDTFDGRTFPIKNGAGKTIWYGCSSDPSRFTRFEAIPAEGSRPAAIVIVSKLGHDEDGSRKACGDARGPTDQCPTSLMLDGSDKVSCVVKSTNGKRCVPVDADAVPYVVIPAAAPSGIDGMKFKALTGLAVGDYGVVIADGRVVPVVVADEGPAYKIGEGSTALLRGLSATGRAKTISRDVAFVLFPGTRDPVANLKPETLAEVVKVKGGDRYRALIAAH